MRRLLAKFCLTTGLVIASVHAAPVAAREVVTASAPEKLSVTVYRAPDRGESERLDPDWPEGFAMISETRTVTLPAGESRIRFDGVAEGMVAASAIVTGLPGGTIEKNRSAALLSPAALVDGTLGNRVTITRTNPATGEQASERAFVRTRADGGLVLQTSAGYEAVRCSGLPEKLTFDGVPAGLSANPVFSIDTRDDRGGTYQVTLTYIAWGFDWQAHYVATLDEGGTSENTKLRLLSWLTVANNNGQSFPDAELLAVAGAINVESDFEGLAEPPRGDPLRLTCYPLGNTKQGDPLPMLVPPPPPPPPAPMMAMAENSIVVTGSRVQRKELDSVAALAVVAQEEQLGDLKLYRVPESMTVAARGLKQVAFLNKPEVRAGFFYRASCDPYDQFDRIEDDTDMESTVLTLAMENEEKRGLGVALPMGGLTLFEPGASGTQLVAELDLRDYAVGQDIELPLGESNLVFSECANTGVEPDEDKPRAWTRMRALLSNANASPARVRMVIGRAGEWDVRWPREKPRIKDGELVVEVTVPANARQEFSWKLRRPKGYYTR